MSEVRKTGIVQKGDSAWNFAKRELKQNNNKVSNAQIMKEMERLAKLNNCESVEDFNSKFFSSVGNEVLIEFNEGKKPSAKHKEASPEADVKRQTQDKIIGKQDTVPKKTQTEAVDSLRVEKAANLDSIRGKDKKAPQFLSPEQQHAKKINQMKDDAQKIIEHNKEYYQGKYYGIVDKKTCKLKIYDKQGNVVKQFTVGVGKKRGDNLSHHYLEKFYNTKDRALAEEGRYTTAGEFTLDEYKKASDAYTGKDGKPKIMHLKGDNKGERGGQQAIHMLYKPNYKEREAAIDSKGLEDNRMSYGCVNLKEEDYDVMHSFLGEGDKLYILPEEKGNKFELLKQNDGSYKFEQAYHKNDKRGQTKEQASKVKYDIRLERNPEYIAKREAQRKAQEMQLAQQKKNEESFKWYNPMTWFS